VKQKWRIKKYAESKGSFFTDKILSDDGSPDLEGRVEKTKIGLKTGQPTQEEIEAAEYVRNYQHRENKELDAAGDQRRKRPSVREILKKCWLLNLLLRLQAHKIQPLEKTKVSCQ
jgi:DNA polymerase/3'-5' exonuclease PolX